MAVCTEGWILNGVDDFDYSGITITRSFGIGTADPVAFPVMHLTAFDTIGNLGKPVVDAADVDVPPRPTSQLGHILDELELEPLTVGDVVDRRFASSDSLSVRIDTGYHINRY